MLNNCRAEDLVKQAERVRRSVTEVCFQTSAGALDVSVSVGAMSIRGVDERTSVESVIKQADLALYQAKAEGRNRVCLAEALMLVG